VEGGECKREARRGVCEKVRGRGEMGVGEGVTASEGEDKAINGG